MDGISIVESEIPTFLESKISEESKPTLILLPGHFPKKDYSRSRAFPTEVSPRACILCYWRFGLGNEEGFKESIRNTQGGYHRKQYESEEVADETQTYRNMEPTAISSRSGSEVHAESRQGVRRPGGVRRRPQTPVAPAPPAYGLLPPPERRRQAVGQGFQGGVRPLRQEIIVKPGTSKIVLTHGPNAPSPIVSPSGHPTIGPEMGNLLKVDANTPADTDHVPSFAAKMFVVREAPKDFHPIGYKNPAIFPRINKRVEVPRTKFFCEEQKYLPGIYADVQLGCKVFHLCLPAAMGNTLTSFMCPNMTLFDQSIMQCNYWYYVNCENSPSNFDANLQMALSYRKINAAQLPLTAVRNFDNVALLSHNSQEMKNFRTITPGDPTIAENLSLRRVGKVDRSGEDIFMDDESEDDYKFRGPRMLKELEESSSPKEQDNEEESVEKEKSRKRRSSSFSMQRH
ncbi:hypothetical protein SK128_024384 [Halocaridina rubra]|uniref:Chitin-binding type-2 domain-containing protein n=1 Tax=Halocaridina rubra TaxID=373956 RepID=A0AAN9A0J0_HALRR